MTEPVTGGPFAVLVAGGGPAGAATALALRRRGVGPVLLVEGSQFDGPRIGESIPPDTRLLFGELGLTEAFAKEGHEPCHGSCSSWGSEELGYNDFLFNPYGHGFHLDRRRFDPWLAGAAVAAGATLSTGTRLVSITKRGDLFDVGLQGPEGALRVEARFLVDATGRPARLARQLGAERLTHDRLTFLYGFFPSGSGAKATSLTLLEAAADGWWYAARLPDGRLVVAVAGDPELMKGENAHRPEVWRARLSRTIHAQGWVAEGSALEGEIIACEAPSARLSRVAGPGWLAVGDAASSFDPLSSQGIHKALGDGLWAAEAIAGWLGSGDSALLERYAARIEERFSAYQKMRAHLYALEQRWAEAPFWARRRASAA